MQPGIAAVAAVAPGQTDAVTFDLPPSDVAQNQSAPGGFTALIQNGLGELNASVGAAESSLRALAAGKTTELHDLMINLERAHISVQTFVQVRNKLVESYQDLMRMQL